MYLRCISGESLQLLVESSMFVARCLSGPVWRKLVLGLNRFKSLVVSMLNLLVSDSVLTFTEANKELKKNV